ncbi:MAG TPA: hypothetical protein VHN12_14295 [Geobacteraceae bacterium]|nr:hypothetical protein [Geobacteraceae bacterium]
MKKERPAAIIHILRLMMADALADRIVKQFPGKFKRKTGGIVHIAPHSCSMKICGENG